MTQRNDLIFHHAGCFLRLFSEERGMRSADHIYNNNGQLPERLFPKRGYLFVRDNQTSHSKRSVLYSSLFSRMTPVTPQLTHLAPDHPSLPGLLPYHANTDRLVAAS